MNEENFGKRRIIVTSPDPDPTISKKKALAKMTEVGKMSLSELLDSFRHLLDEKLEPLATKEDVRVEISAIREECAQLRNVVDGLARQHTESERRIEKLEQYNRRNNLIFRGITVDNMNAKMAVEIFGRNFLDILDMRVVRAFFLGRMKKSIVAEFISEASVVDVLKECKKLKGTKIVVSRDYTPSMRVKRGALFAIKKNWRRLTIQGR